MLSLYLSEPSWLHRVRPGTKLLVLAAASMALLPSTSLVLLLTVSLLAVLGYLSLLARGRRRLVVLLKTAGLLAGLVGVFQFGLVYSSSGLVLAGELALVSALRLLALVMLADLVSVTTPITEMLAVFRRILAPLNRLGVSTDTLTLLVGLLIRATSLIQQRLQTIQDAYRVRCGRSAGIRAVAPLVRQTFEANHRLAEALEARSLRVQPSYQQATGQASSSRD
ncbi:hypothetical protein GH816_03215 [Betaproteobacteria bacterium LSUCC0115]|nr:hypothetical protein [Burkholderiales bacterium LSUCC0115]